MTNDVTSAVTFSRKASFTQVNLDFILRRVQVRIGDLDVFELQDDIVLGHLDDLGHTYYTTGLLQLHPTSREIHILSSRVQSQTYTQVASERAARIF